MNAGQKFVTKIAFNNIPLIGSILKEVLEYSDDMYLNTRLEKLEDQLKLINKYESFLRELTNLSEHRYFTFRTNLKFLLTTALPEITDSFISALIESVVGGQQNMAEEICEILRQLNANDIETLKMLKGNVEKNKEKINAG